MNLAIRHIEADLGESWADSFHDDRHKDLRADFVIANPPFNFDEWDGAKLRGDPRWVYGDPPPGNANFAWVQHFLSHLAPTGTAGFVLANGALSVQGLEGEIRKKIIEADLVDCILALPTNLFFGTTIPVTLWFLTKSKRANGHRDRQGQTLFIDARSLGSMVTRVQRVLSSSEVSQVAETYRAWRGKASNPEYADVVGFCRSATIDEIKAFDCSLSPGRYVGFEAADEAEPASEFVSRLTATMGTQLAEVNRLGGELMSMLERLEHDG